MTNNKIFLFRQIQFMQKSLYSQSPYKKRAEYTALSESANRQVGGLNHYTEIKIETHNREVPFISIYKPDSTKQQHRIQAVTLIYKFISHYQTFRLQYALRKIIASQIYRKRLSANCWFLVLIVNKIQTKKLGSAFHMLSAIRMKKRIAELAVKSLNRLQTNSKIYNCRLTLQMLKLNSNQQKINAINDSNQQVKRINFLEQQLKAIKNALFSQQFIAKSKTFQKISVSLIQKIRKNDYQNTINLQIKRFQQQRLKANPKKREMFETQIILTVLMNIIKSYELLAAQPDKNIKFIIQQGEQQLFPQRYFKALSKTLERSKITPEVISLILSYKQNFLQNYYKTSQLQQKIACQSQIQQMAIVFTKLKTQNDNLKTFQSNYYDQLSKNSQKESIIEQLKKQISNRQQEIMSLKQRVKYYSEINVDLTQRINMASSKTGINSSPTRIDQFSVRSSSKIGFQQKSSNNPIVLMRQILNLKMTLQTNTMNHEKELRQIRNQMFEYQTEINQWKADMFQKQHQFLKVLQDKKQLKSKIFELSKIEVRKSHKTRPSMGQVFDFQLAQLKQQKQTILGQLKQQKISNQALMVQVNQAKRQTYKRQRRQQQRLARRDQQIKLLTNKVKQLQELLLEITESYHQIQTQIQNAAQSSRENTSIITFREQKDSVKHSQQTQKVDEESSNYKNLSQKLKHLMASSESLVYSIDPNPKQEVDQICLSQIHQHDFPL